MSTEEYENLRIGDLINFDRNKVIGTCFCNYVSSSYEIGFIDKDGITINDNGILKFLFSETVKYYCNVKYIKKEKCKGEVDKELKNLIENNKVNHPKYYNSHPSDIECIDIIRYYNFDIGNVFKYLWRAGLKQEEGYDIKEKELEDCEKAMFYLQDYINQLKNKLNKNE